jgi:hypothetical protein
MFLSESISIHMLLLPLKTAPTKCAGMYQPPCKKDFFNKIDYLLTINQIRK